MKAHFFFKLRNVPRFYKQLNKQRAKAHIREELDIGAMLEVATTKLHEDDYNVDKHG